MVTPTGYTALDLVGFTDKGPYSALENYVKNDLAHYAGGIWRCKIDDTTNVTPAENANWTVFVSDRSNLVEASIAPIETSPATAAHAQGSQLFYNDTLYKAKTAIAIGDSLVVDTNIEEAPNVTTQLEAKANTADLGTAAAKDSTNAVTSGSTDLVESGAVASELSTLDSDKVDWTDFAELGAVNLCENVFTSQVINDVTFTKNSDGSLTVSGTASATVNTSNNSGGFIFDTTLNKGTYKFSVGQTTRRIFYIINGVIVQISSSGTDTFTIESNNSTFQAYFYCQSGFASNHTYYPMLTLASYNGDYVPYAKTNKELTDDIDTVSSQISDLTSYTSLLTTNPTTWIDSSTSIGLKENLSAYSRITINGYIDTNVGGRRFSISCDLNALRLTSGLFSIGCVSVSLLTTPINVNAWYSSSAELRLQFKDVATSSDITNTVYISAVLGYK